MDEAVVGGLVGGILPMLVAIAGFMFRAGKLEAGVEGLHRAVDQFREEMQSTVGDLREDLKLLRESIIDLTERVAALEGSSGTRTTR